LAIPDIHAVIDRALAAAATQQELFAPHQVGESASKQQYAEGSVTATVVDLAVINAI
jgi:hypothetical protein